MTVDPQSTHLEQELNADEFITPAAKIRLSLTRLFDWARAIDW
ncbi:hypothetical protein ACFVAJ_18715 [Agromyces sp. NPDC057679]